MSAPSPKKRPHRRKAAPSAAIDPKYEHVYWWLRCPRCKAVVKLISPVNQYPELLNCDSCNHASPTGSYDVVAFTNIPLGERTGAMREAAERALAGGTP